jgi:hypothetical protein
MRRKNRIGSIEINAFQRERWRPWHKAGEKVFKCLEKLSKLRNYVSQIT